MNASGARPGKWLLVLGIAVAAALGPAASAQSAGADPEAVALAKARDERLLLLAAADFDPATERPALPADLLWGADDALGMTSPPTSDYFILQLRSSPTPADHEALAAIDAVELDYLRHHAYILRVSTAALPGLLAWERTRALIPFEPGFRIEPDLLAFAAAAESGSTPLDVAILLFPGCDTQSATLELMQRGADLLDPDAGLHERLLARVPADRLVALARVRDVQWIQPQSVPTFRNGITTWVIQSNVTNQTPVWNHGLLGENVIIGHIDGAIDLDSCYFEDPLFTGPDPNHRKVVSHHGSFGNPDGHGTHTAGTSAGDREPIDGATTNNGIAYHARLAHTNLGNVSSTNLDAKLIELYQDGARVFTNSWGDDTTTKYNAWCNDIDRVSWDNLDALVCFAVTNLGSLKNPENAKNVLAVGGTLQAPNQDRHYSGGRGPTADGRRKPEIYSPGDGIVSANDNGACGTTSMGGTSMACPSITAAAALTKQYFEEGFWPSGAANPADAFVPSGALLKAVLLDASVDMTGVSGYPSNTEGWGRLLLDDGLHFAGDSRTLWLVDVPTVAGFDLAGEVQTHYVHVNGSGESLEICLVFTDKQGAVNSSQPVVNDLDLTVLASDGSLYLGNVFSGGVSVTGGAVDPLNNVERVKLDSPPAGWYTLTVSSTTIGSQRKQSYALVATGDLDPPADGGFATYGSGTQGSGGFVPGLAGSGSPTIGDAVTLDLTNGLGGATTMMLIGFGRATIPFAGGNLLVAPPWIVLPLKLGGTNGVAGAGSLTLIDTLPADPTIVGAIVDFQAIVFDPVATKGMALTNGLEMTIGS